MLAPWWVSRTIIHHDQIQYSGGAFIGQGTLFFFNTSTNVSAGNTFTISDGTTVETWTYQVGAETAPFQVQIKADIWLSLAALRQAISDDSTAWESVYVDFADDTHLGYDYIVLYRTTISANNDRIYGSLGGSSPQYFNFAGEWDYAKGAMLGANVALPSSDPTTKTFGPAFNLYPSQMVVTIHQPAPYVCQDSIVRPAGISVTGMGVIANDQLVRWNADAKGLAWSDVTLNDAGAMQGLYFVEFDETSGGFTTGTGKGSIFVKNTNPTSLWFKDSGNTAYQLGGGGATFVYSTSTLADHCITRGDGGVRNIQQTGITIDDSDNVAMPTGAKIAWTLGALNSWIAANGTVSTGDITIRGADRIIFEAGGQGTYPIYIDSNLDINLPCSTVDAAGTRITWGTNRNIGFFPDSVGTPYMYFDSTDDFRFLVDGTTKWRFDDGANSLAFGASPGVIDFGSSTNIQGISGSHITLTAAGNVSLVPTLDVLVNNGSVNWVRFDTSERALAIWGTATPAGAAPNTLYAEAAETTIVGIDNNTTGVTKRGIEIDFPSSSTTGNVPTTTRWCQFLYLGVVVGSIRGNGADLTTVVYDPFSGQHNSQTEGSTLDEDGNIDDGTVTWKTGMILSTTGSMVSHGSKVDGQPQVKLTDTAADSCVVGIYTAGSDDASEMGAFDPDLPVSHYSAVGRGKIRVTNKAGEVNKGDLVVSSTIPGYGQKQADDIIRSSTVCKVTQQIVWANVTDTIDEGGNTYKWALLACFVYCG